MRYKILILLLIGLCSAAFTAEPLANKNIDGLYVRSIEQMLRLEPEEVDIGTAALIIAEQWSDFVHGVKYQVELDDMAYELQDRIAKADLKERFRAIPIINEYLFEELEFKAVKEAKDPNDLFLNTVIDNRRGYCLSLSILYLSLCERLGLPMHGVVVPGHFFVRYDDGINRFNIETTSNGANPKDEYYLDKYCAALDMEETLYMQNLNKLESIGCLFNNFGNIYIEIDDYEQAQIALETAIEINPGLAESHTNLGNVLLHQGKINDAIYEYELALDILGEDSKIYNNLGNAYMRKDWLNEAMGSFEKVIELEPDDESGYINLAGVYMKKQLLDKAIVYLNEAISINPKRSDIRTQKADILFDQKKYEKSIKEYDFAIKVNNKDVQAIFGKALCYNKLGMTKQEIASYKKVLKVKPDMIPALANLGTIYYNKGQYDQAIDYYKVALEAEPSNPNISFNIGASYGNLGKHDFSVPYFENAIKHLPAMAEAHYHLAIAFYNLKEYPKAYEHLTAAKKLGLAVDEKIEKAIQKKVK